VTGHVCLVSSALAHGWKVKVVPERPQIAVPKDRRIDEAVRSRMALTWTDLEETQVEGLATDAATTLEMCGRRLPFDEALAIADSALRHRDVTKQELIRRAEAMPGRYRARCLRVVGAATGKPANPFESVLFAIALDVRGLTVEPQVWVEDIGRPDLVDRMLHLVLEADSFEFHGKRQMLKRDCERYNAFVVAGWLVLRFAYEHVMFDPDYVRSVLVAAVELLGRGSLGRALGEGPQRRTA
jgi:very-short-patch-repair endonuclease